MKKILLTSSVALLLFSGSGVAIASPSVASATDCGTLTAAQQTQLQGFTGLKVGDVTSLNTPLGSATLTCSHTVTAADLAPVTTTTTPTTTTTTVTPKTTTTTVSPTTVPPTTTTTTVPPTTTTTTVPPKTTTTTVTRAAPVVPTTTTTVPPTTTTTTVPPTITTKTVTPAPVAPAVLPDCGVLDQLHIDAISYLINHLGFKVGNTATLYTSLARTQLCTHVITAGDVSTATTSSTTTTHIPGVTSLTTIPKGAVQTGDGSTN